MGKIVGVFEPRYRGDTRAAQLFDEVERLKEKLAQTVRERDAARRALMDVCNDCWADGEGAYDRFLLKAAQVRP